MRNFDIKFTKKELAAAESQRQRAKAKSSTFKPKMGDKVELVYEGNVLHGTVTATYGKQCELLLNDGSFWTAFIPDLRPSSL